MSIITCPHCGTDTHGVVCDTRGAKVLGVHIIWRRRECHSCEARYNTFEISESILQTRFGLPKISPFWNKRNSRP